MVGSLCFIFVFIHSRLAIISCSMATHTSQQKHVLCPIMLRDNIMLYYRKGGMVL